MNIFESPLSQKPTIDAINFMQSLRFPRNGYVRPFIVFFENNITGIY